MQTITGALYNLQQSEIDQIELLISRQNSAKRMIFQDLYKGKDCMEAIKRAQSLITDIPRRYIYSAKDILVMNQNNILAMEFT